MSFWRRGSSRSAMTRLAAAPEETTKPHSRHGATLRASQPGHTVTAALQRLRTGGTSARDDLLVAVYGTLLRSAGQVKRRWSARWLETADIAHRAILRVIDNSECAWKNRAQFYAVVAETMRRVVHDLVDWERAGKRGGTARVSLTEEVAIETADVENALALEEALARLEAHDARMARVVVMRCYGGFELNEIALALDVSRRTVDRLWCFAKVWLREEMESNRTTRVRAG